MPRQIGQIPITRLPASQQLIPNVRTDAELSVQLPPVRSLLQSKTHELTSLIHD
jgi:hypothetical protein